MEFASFFQTSIELLRQARMERGLTQGEVATALTARGISVKQAYLSLLESGKRTEVNLHLLYEWARFLEINLGMSEDVVAPKKTSTLADSVPLMQAAIARVLPNIPLTENLPQDLLKTWEAYSQQYLVDLPLETLEVFDTLYQFSSKTLKGKSASKGFAGVALVAVLGRLLKPDYRPHQNFYDIHPRSLFEKFIFPVLREYRAPIGKSDPLNVAKNIGQINLEWARGKDPESAARAAVQLTEWASDANETQLQHMLEGMMWWYLTLGRWLGHTLEAPQYADQALDVVYLCSELIKKAPAGGYSAQAIVGLMLKMRLLFWQSPLLLEGLGESVYSTNTTSKKAGDFILCTESQNLVYEVTTKKIDLKRLEDSFDATMSTRKKGTHSTEVVFLCTLENVSELSIERLPAQITLRNLKFGFINLFEWIELHLFELGHMGRLAFVQQLTLELESSDDIALKTLWKQLVS